MKIDCYMLVLVICFILGMVWGGQANASYYNQTQLDNLEDASRIWKSVTGFKETGMAILMQETRGGMEDRVGDDGKSLGLFHVTENAALDVIKACKDGKYEKHCSLIYVYIRDKKSLRLRLMLDDRFNAVVAALYFKIQYDYLVKHGYDRPWTRANVAYNSGLKIAKKLSAHKINNHERMHWINYRLNNLRRYL